ncbi:MAG: hypothetical protein ABJD07_06675, partial [Gemmatimonadaceae bacterium]
AVVVVAALRASPVSAQGDAHAEHDVRRPAGSPKLGTVRFPNSGARAAQAPFLRGIAFLHSFEYADAADAFLAAQKADSNFALAYWGEALTYRHTLWGQEDLDAARAALTKLAAGATARLAMAHTARERAYGAAIEALFADADEGARVQAFDDSMRSVVHAYPADLEAKAFASLAIQSVAIRWTPTEGRDVAIRDAAALAEEVFRASPRHPGAAHYLVHVYDDPTRAASGIRAARAYAAIAPAAEHALHMPSHIFVQLGMWDDVVASNERAWSASRAWVKARGARPTALDFHGFVWLQYGYLQQGRYAAARALIDSARTLLAGEDLSDPELTDARYAVERLAFQYAAVTGRWDAVREYAPEPTAGAVGASQRAQSFARASQYGRAAAGAMLGDPAAAAAVAAASRARTAPAALMNAYALEGLAARARGDTAAAIERFTRAAAVEDSVPAVGPPTWIPAHELLGNALLDAKRTGMAAAAFEGALKLYPNRSPSLLGLARARAALGDDPGARATYRKLADNWRRADDDVLAPIASLARPAPHRSR